jgi:hypothetical protein
MKVIRRGESIPTRPQTPPELAWWVGRQATCPYCGAVVEFESTDNVKPTNRLPNMTPDRIYADCPEDHPKRGDALTIRIDLI